MAEFGKVSSAVNRDQDDIDLEQVKPQNRVDNDEFRKVFDRPYVAPRPSESGYDPSSEVQTSHYDYNFDEKDYKSRRISSTRYHEPLQRIHSRSRLHKLDKTDGSSRKEKRKSRELREVNVLPKINEGQEHKGHYSDSDERPRSLTDFPLIKKRHHHHHRHHSRHHHEPKDVKDKKENKDAKDLKDLREKSHHHHHRHHHHRHPPIPAVHQHRTISEREQLQSRLRSGALTLQEIEPIQERLATKQMKQASWLKEI